MANVKVISKDLEGKEVICYLKRPSPRENIEAKIQSNILASRLLNTRDANGKPAVILRSQADEHLKSLGVWSDKDEQDIKDMAKEVGLKERLLAAGGANGTTKDKARQLAIDIIKLRDKQNEIFSKRRELDRLTLESQTEQANFDTLVSLCVLDESGNRVFSDVEDYQNRVAEPFAYQCALELSKIVYGSDNDDYRKDLPEYKFLQKYGYVNDKFQFVNKDKQLIDVETGKRIDDEGYYLNDNGERVDLSGNLLNVDGTYKIEFIEFNE